MLFRSQIAVDPIYFSDDNKILPVEPKHNGIGYLAESTNPFENLAYNKNVKASSYYNDDFRPEYVVDDNNATLWRPKTCGKEWLEIDLGSAQNVKRIWCEFEYPTVFYQYKLLTSMDGNNWDIFSDRSGNLLMGSPMVDFGYR